MSADPPLSTSLAPHKLISNDSFSERLYPTKVTALPNASFSEIPPSNSMGRSVAKTVSDERRGSGDCLLRPRMRADFTTQEPIFRRKAGSQVVHLMAKIATEMIIKIGSITRTPVAGIPHVMLKEIRCKDCEFILMLECCAVRAKISTLA